ncbi:hypothetical protein KY338_03680 [Candidatus Woesearchaeota archaeon]|nr:hypothetical protein [Candidatus Woesearchaeota archaeon]MBW3005412.1 hypothetical protein [Candidatus Woesearchaeota archaeon]
MKKAIWVYSDSPENIMLIRQYNEQGGNVHNCYTRFASIEFSKNKIMFKDYVTKAWSNAGFDTYPIISAPKPEGKHIKYSSAQDIAEIIDVLFSKLNEIPFCGLHLNLEPYHPQQHRFLGMLRERTQKPITAALPGSIAIDPKILSKLDTAVLMNYDLALNPEKYKLKFKERLERFAESCEKTGCKWSIGIPLTATHTEYEEKRLIETEHIRKFTNYAMANYFLPAYQQIKETAKHVEHFDGIAIWAINSRPLRDSKKKWEIHPWQLTLNSLQLLD